MNIKDNPPPLPEPAGIIEFSADIGWSETQVRQIEAAAFARGVAAGRASMQEEIERLKQIEKNYLASRLVSDELRAKLKALEEQKPVGCAHKDTLAMLPALRGHDGGAKIWPARKVAFDTNYVPLYLAALPDGGKSIQLQGTDLYVNEHTEQSERSELIESLRRMGHVACSSESAILYEAAALLAADKAGKNDQWRMAVDEAMVGVALDCTTDESDPRQCVELLVKHCMDIGHDIGPSDKAGGEMRHTASTGRISEFEGLMRIRWLKSLIEKQQDTNRSNNGYVEYDTGEWVGPEWVDTVHEALDDLVSAAEASKGFRFLWTRCSSCGQEFGPGDCGYSHCSDHVTHPQPQSVPDDVVNDAERYFPPEFEVWQGDEMCASASGPRDIALREAMRYASQYGQDGPVRVFEVRRIAIDAAMLKEGK